MTTMIEKARLGRMNALAARPGAGADQPRNRSSIGHERVTFISSRARAMANTQML